MPRSLIVLIAAAFATGAMAQTTATPTSPPADTKTKQEMVNATTAGSGPISPQTAAKSTKAAAEKGTPRKLTDKTAKQEAVKSATAGSGSPSPQTAAKSTKAAAEKDTPRAPTPKPQIDSPALKEAAKP